MIFPDFPNLPHPPHDYQRDAFLSFATEAYEGTGRSQLIVMATGLGKSVTACLIARDAIENRGGRVLVLAHLENLINQLTEEFEYWGLANTVEKADRKALDMAKLGTIGSKCVVACVATMKGKRLAAWPNDYFDLIITDEAHRAPSDSYKDIYRHFSKAKLLGFTATPNRPDEKNLGEIFEHKAYEYLLPAAIENGELCNLVMHEVKTGIDLRSIKVIGRGQDRDFDPDAVADAIGPHVVDLAKAIILGDKLGPGQTLIFAPCRLSAQAFASAFTGLGVPARAIDYKTDDRAKVIEKFKLGTMEAFHEFSALANYGLLTTGFNHKSVGNIVLARPTKSNLLLEQILGRGTRRCEGKKECRVIDFEWIVDPDKIAKPTDLFLPPGTEPFIRDAVRKLANGLSPAEAMAEAERLAKEEAEKKEKRDAAKKRQAEKHVQVTVRDKAPVKHKSRSFDLFAVRSLSQLRMDEPRECTVRMPVSAGSAAKLKELGFDSTDGMSQREADREIAYWTERKECGMASLKQCKFMVKQGMPSDRARMLTSNEAQSVIGPMMAKYQKKLG